MRDTWMDIRWKLIVGAGVVVGTVVLAVILLLIMALGGVWGPGWLGDLVDVVVG